MAILKDELVILSDFAWQRIHGRLDGLTDEEYFWEPAPGCWTIGTRPDATWRADTVMPRPDPEPFTTIAWRMWHLIDMYGENRAPTWLDVEPQGPPIGLDDPTGAPPSSARAAIDLLARAHERWDAHLSLVSDDQLAQAVGPVGGEYADSSRAGYVLHMLDEFIHHGAEIALLRDLWRWQHPLDADPSIERAMRGDLEMIDDLAQTDAPTARNLLAVAASYARWDLVEAMVRAGTGPDTDGPTPLHRACGAGEIGTVRLLVARGADLARRDPQFDETPLGWARFMGRDDIVAWLEANTDT